MGQAARCRQNGLPNLERSARAASAFNPALTVTQIMQIVNQLLGKKVESQ
jgi:hypothetical protein